MELKKIINSKYFVRSLCVFVTFFMGTVLKVKAKWLALSFLGLLPAPFSIPILIISIIKILIIYNSSTNINYYIFIFVISLVISLIENIEEKISYSVSLVFLFFTIAIPFNHFLTRTIDIDNISFLVYVFVLVGITSQLTGRFIPQKKITLENLITQAKITLSDTFTVLLEIMDERKHHLVKKRFPKTTKLLDRYWPIAKFSIYRVFAVATVIGTAYVLTTAEVGRLNFYRDFFSSHQIKEYLFTSGFINLTIIIMSITCIVGLLVSKRVFLRVPFILLVFLLGNWLTTTIYQEKTELIRYSVWIWSVKPDKVHEAWTDVTISGRNFKENPFSANVYVHGVGHRVISWTDREIIFRTDPTITTSGKLFIKNIEGKISNQIDFEYNPQLKSK